MALRDERCGVCGPDTPRLSPAEVSALLIELPEWQVEGVTLVRQRRYRDFAAALRDAVAIGAVAEAEGHHPDLHVAWGRLRITVSTHAVRGLTRADFVLAAKIDAVLGGRG